MDVFWQGIAKVQEAAKSASTYITDTIGGGETNYNEQGSSPVSPQKPLSVGSGYDEKSFYNYSGSSAAATSSSKTSTSSTTAAASGSAVSSSSVAGTATTRTSESPVFTETPHAHVSSNRADAAFSTEEKAQYEKISSSHAFLEFRATVPLRKIAVEDDKYWTVYEAGPREKPALVMLHGTSGSAIHFFSVMTLLSEKGYHVISAQYPPYWSVSEWVEGFNQFVNAMEIQYVHLLGASLGGFLALHYVCRYPERVTSLSLCNGFCDTLQFEQSEYCLATIPYLPEFYLKQYIYESFPKVSQFPNVIDFVVEQVESLSQEDTASRLILNCLPSRITKVPLSYQHRICLIDAHDDVMLPGRMRQRLYELLPNAKMALLKEGGDFPFLADPETVAMHLQIHLRNFGVYGKGAEKPPELSPTVDAVEASGASAESVSEAVKESFASNNVVIDLNTKPSDEQLAKAKDEKYGVSNMFAKINMPKPAKKSAEVPSANSVVPAGKVVSREDVSLSQPSASSSLSLSAGTTAAMPPLPTTAAASSFSAGAQANVNVSAVLTAAKNERKSSIIDSLTSDQAESNLFSSQESAPGLFE